MTGSDSENSEKQLAVPVSTSFSPVRDDRQQERDLFEKVIENQLREFELRSDELEFNREELELEKQQSAQAFEFSKKSLDVNADDLRRVRERQDRTIKYSFLALGLFMILSFGFLFSCIWLGKEAVVNALIDKFAYILGGGGAVALAQVAYKHLRPIDPENNKSEK